MIGVLIHNSVPIPRLFCFWGLVLRFSDSLDCKAVVFFSKSVKKWVKRCVRVLLAGSARALERLSPVLLSVFSLVPDLLFDCLRALEYAKVQTVLQSTDSYSCLKNHIIGALSLVQVF